MMSSTMPLTSLMGMAKPRPSMVALLELEPDSLAEVMPMTWPYMSKRGPPELPELMAVSVWIMFMTSPFSMVMLRSLAEMMPEVME